MKNPLLGPLCALALVAVVACDDTTEPVSKIVTFKATLTPSAEVPTPPVASSGSGTFTATLDTSTNVFTYDLTFTGLTSAVNNGHIHGPAATGVTAGSTINFNTLTGATFSFGQTSGTGHGTVVLSSGTAITSTINGDSLKKLLFAGLTYANIHTTSNPAGEIRGQITKQP
ncbi:MAG TPA: CHRD domain-containing protein [Gemmatimonadaceae bacterium]|nr:CHRD domain-containing protein [Gemmatimonadaceae bacterium]